MEITFVSQPQTPTNARALFLSMYCPVRVIHSYVVHLSFSVTFRLKNGTSPDRRRGEIRRHSSVTWDPTFENGKCCADSDVRDRERNMEQKSFRKMRWKGEKRACVHRRVNRFQRGEPPLTLEPATIKAGSHERRQGNAIRNIRLCSYISREITLNPSKFRKLRDFPKIPVKNDKLVAFLTFPNFSNLVILVEFINFFGSS